jgi:hypothetical protein
MLANDPAMMLIAIKPLSGLNDLWMVMHQIDAARLTSNPAA